MQEREGMVSLFSLEARALLVAVSLGFAMSHKLGPFQALPNGPSNMCVIRFAAAPLRQRRIQQGSDARSNRLTIPQMVSRIGTQGSMDHTSAWLLSPKARALLAAVSLTAAWQRNLFHSKRCLNGTANSATTCRWQAASARQRRTQQGPDARSSSQSVRNQKRTAPTSPRDSRGGHREGLYTAWVTNAAIERTCGYRYASAANKFVWILDITPLRILPGQYFLN